MSGSDALAPARATIGLDIGGTKILGICLAPDGTVEAESRVDSPVTGLAPLVDACAELVENLGGDTAAPVGVGVAGLVDFDGRLTYAPNIPGVRDAPLRDALVDRTGRTVVVDNDANVAALGEATYGAARGARHALMVTLGTGIGGGIVLDGEIFRGAHGFAAEIGHITIERDGPPCACGERGHWEAIASGSALGRMARELVAEGRGRAIVEAAGAEDAVDGRDVGTAARAGDPEALALLARFADNVALGLASLANVLDPERIVVAGGLVALGPLLFEPLVAAFEVHLEGTEHRPRLPVVAAELGERAGAVGAGVLARRLDRS
jgi:glucokinase